MLEFLEKRLKRDLHLDVLPKDQLVLYLQAQTLKIVNNQEILASAHEFPATASEFACFNPPQVELKANAKNRYPFKGSTFKLKLDFEKLAKLQQQENLQKEILLIVDEQFAGNTVIDLKIAPTMNWQIHCLNLSCTEHCTYLKCDLDREANLKIACLSLAEVNNQAAQGFCIYAEVAKDANFESVSCNFKGSAYNDTIVHLNAEGANASAYAAMFVNSGLKQSTQLEIRHHKPHTESFMLCNGVVAAHSSGEFVGRGYIDKAANGSNCRQESRFLTLDRTAKAKTYPLLVIDEYDVQAGHATSVGQLDPDSLYYMQSRGLSSQLAKKLMTRGFLIPVVDRFSHPLLNELGVTLLDEQTNTILDQELSE